MNIQLSLSLLPFKVMTIQLTEFNMSYKEIKAIEGGREVWRVQKSKKRFCFLAILWLENCQKGRPYCIFGHEMTKMTKKKIALPTL